MKYLNAVLFITSILMTFVFLLNYHGFLMLGSIGVGAYNLVRLLERTK